VPSQMSLVFAGRMVLARRNGLADLAHLFTDIFNNILNLVVSLLILLFSLLVFIFFDALRNSYPLQHRGELAYGIPGLHLRWIPAKFDIEGVANARVGAFAISTAG